MPHPPLLSAFSGLYVFQSRCKSLILNPPCSRKKENGLSFSHAGMLFKQDISEPKEHFFPVDKSVINPYQAASMV